MHILYVISHGIYLFRNKLTENPHRTSVTNWLSVKDFLLLSIVSVLTNTILYYASCGSFYLSHAPVTEETTSFPRKPHTGPPRQLQLWADSSTTLPEELETTRPMLFCVQWLEYALVIKMLSWCIKEMSKFIISELAILYLIGAVVFFWAENM